MAFSEYLNFTTLESGINVALQLLIFGLFSRGYGLIPDFIVEGKNGATIILFDKFSRGLRLFKGVRLFQTLEYQVQVKAWD